MSKRLALALLGVVFVASGTYSIIYLVRWEWHRAIIAGLFFIGAEVALVAGALVSRLRAIERRLDAGLRPEPAVSPDVRVRIHEAAPPPRQPFAWLSREPDQFNVFLPVLLGAGVLVSAAAWLLELLARATARPVLEHDLATRMAPMNWPQGGLLGTGGTTSAGRGRRRPPAVLRAGLSLGVVVGVSWGLVALADAIQNRPDDASPVVQTSIDLRMSGSRLTGGAEAVARDLWGACKLVLNRGVPQPVVVPLDENRVRLVLAHDLGRHAGARLRGCLQDTNIDHVQAGVLAVTRHRAETD